MLQIKYVGLDVHKATTVAAVVCADGSVFIRAEIPTTEEAILRFVQSLSGTIHVAFEEGTQAQWLHDLIEPLVSSVTVCRGLPRASKRNKSDRGDALELARQLRLEELKPVFHRYSSNLRHLRHLVRAYEPAVSDSVRTMLRLKARRFGSAPIENFGRTLGSRSGPGAVASLKFGRERLSGLARR